MTTTETTTNGGTPSPTGQAIAVVTPKAMVTQYEDSFKAVLPSHITKPETWLRVAQGALKKGRLYEGGPNTELEVAAANNPGVFLSTLLDAARLGLEPGTEQYYLTPRKVKGRLEILGIIGYQGIVELMFRAGAVESVVAECVYTADRFEYRPGVDHIPVHEIDWDADDRGRLRLVYAFARMRGGAISKVVVMNKVAIDKIKSKSQGADSKYSPWQTDPDAMWLKSAVRNLRKWVPTSAEYRRVAIDGAGQLSAGGDAERAPYIDAPDLPPVDALDGDFDDGDDVVDAEIVDVEPSPANADGEPTPEPDPDDDVPPSGGGGGGAPASDGVAAPDGVDLFSKDPEPEPATEPEPAPAAKATAAVGIKDVARYAGQVFRAAADAAPGGQKTKVVERLRYAITFAETGGKKVSLNDLEGDEIIKVHQRLKTIQDGQLSYEADDTGVVFTMVSSGKQTRVGWEQVDALVGVAA